ncbi:unnamed protein product [Aphis gossypii]|uniref:Uncharacterized protein n=1 Tax=Aphis gossypii TaxID=80765 RepID=A0A9P0IX91_APHGO|nr:unnamed protein product [Aphis gossypii]
METVREEAPKRTLGEADDDGNGTKRLKTDPETYQFLSTVENIKTVNDPKKWNILPSIVYDLLALLKKTEKPKSVEEKRDKLDTDFKEVSSNQNCQEKLLNNASKHDNLKEEDKCHKISIEDFNLKVPNTTKVSIQNTNKLDLSSEYITENVPKKSKASPVQLFVENTAVHKAEEIKDESNRKTIVVKELHTSTDNAYNLSVSTNNFPCTDPFTNDISKAVMSTESVSNVATSTYNVYNTPFLAASGTNISNTLNTFTNSIYNTAIHSSKSSNTIIVPENSTQQVISITKKNFREQMFEILNEKCFNNISKILLTKPSLCTCKGCTFVTSLPIKQSAAYSLLFTSNDLESSNVPDAGSSISPKNDCNSNQSNTPCRYQKTLTYEDSPKNIWINHLTSLINKKDSSSQNCHHTTNKIDVSKKLNSVQNVINKVHKITRHISSNLPFCSKCKGPKLNKYNSCKCSRSLNRCYKKDK